VKIRREFLLAQRDHIWRLRDQFFKQGISAFSVTHLVGRAVEMPALDEDVVMPGFAEECHRQLDSLGCPQVCPVSDRRIGGISCSA
jgi:hypothetical protein